MKHYQLFKLRAVLLLFALLCSMPNVWADKQYINGVSGPMWEIDEETSTLIISGEGEMPDFSSYDATPWSEGYYYEGISIEAGITTIGNYSFSAPLNHVTSISLPDGLTSIGDYAFKYCEFTTVTIPSTVTNIGTEAFCGTSLESICISSNWTTIGKGAFASSQINSITFGDGVQTIGEEMFMHCLELQSVSIPNTVTTIGSKAFYECSSLESVTLPDNISEIGASVFCLCISLKSIEIPNSVTTIGNGAFQYCGLTSLNIPAHVTSIGQYAFGYTKMTSLTIPDNVTSVDNYAFKGCRLLETLSVPNIRFEPETFEGCEKLSSLEIRGSGDMPNYTSTNTTKSPWTTVGESLETVVISTGITSIGDHAFAALRGLETVSLPNTITSIGKSAFYWTHISSITLPNSLLTIGDYAFSNCPLLSSITIPDNVTSIGKYAFNHCSLLETVTLPNSLLSIGDNAFSDCPLLSSITIPASVTSIGGYAFEDCPKLESISVANENTKYDSRNNCNAIIEKSSDVLLVGCQNTVIPNTVKSIGDGAFSGCSNLVSITIPGSVTNIGGGAFFYCTNLSSCTIPASVTKIGNIHNAFGGCRKMSDVFCLAVPDDLTWIENDWEFKTDKATIFHVTDKDEWIAKFPDANVTFVGDLANIEKLSATVTESTATMKVSEGEASSLSGELAIPATYNDGTGSYPVTAIGDAAFSNCTNLTSVSIPSGVTSIGESAFSGCTGISSVSIPSGVTSIGQSAFAGCTSLTSATLPSGLTSISQSAFTGCSSLASVSIPNTITSIGKEAFKGTGLTTVEIPYNVEAVGESSFEGCSGLVSVELPTNLAIIAKNTFLDCTNMTTVNIPVATTEIKDGAFKNCQKLVAVSLPSGLVELGMGAFEASGLKSISLPPGVTAIAANTFKSCQSLVSATLYSPTVATVSDDSFSDNHQDLKIKVPNDLLDAYRGGISNVKRNNRSASWSSYSSKIYPITLDLNADPEKSTDKWCTYYNDLANMTVPSGTTIYKAQLDQVNNKVVLTEVEGSVVAKGNAVMLKSSDANIALSSATTSDLGTYSDNDLKGGDVTSGYIAYTLAGINGIMGFYRFTGNSLDPNKAHLEVANSNPNSAPQLIPFDNGTTEIMLNTVKTAEDKGEWYSLDGRQIQGKPTQKGVYVKKGKKYVVK